MNDLAGRLQINGIPPEVRATVERLSDRASDDLTGVAEAVDNHVDHLRVLSRDVPQMALSTRSLTQMIR